MTQAERITELLTEKGITQKEVAKRAGVIPASVSAIISGRSRSYKVEKIITELTGFKFPPFKRVPLTLSKKLKKEVQDLAEDILKNRELENV